MKKMNPRLEEQYKKIARNQIKSNTPPETKQTYDRLISQGHSEDDAIQLIACAGYSEVFNILKDRRCFDMKSYIEMLNKLPELP